MPKVGSGKRNAFSLRQIFELLVALEAEQQTRSAKKAVLIAQVAVAGAWPPLATSYLLSSGEIIEVMSEAAARDRLSFSSSTLVLNLSRLFSLLKQKLPDPSMALSVYRERDGA